MRPNSETVLYSSFLSVWHHQFSIISANCQCKVNLSSRTPPNGTDLGSAVSDPSVSSSVQIQVSWIAPRKTANSSRSSDTTIEQIVSAEGLYLSAESEAQKAISDSPAVSPTAAVVVLHYTLNETDTTGVESQARELTASREPNPSGDASTDLLSVRLLSDAKLLPSTLYRMMLEPRSATTAAAAPRFGGLEGTYFDCLTPSGKITISKKEIGAFSGGLGDRRGTVSL